MSDYFKLNDDLGTRRWKAVIETHLGLHWSDATRMRVKRAFNEYETHGDGGAHTFLASGGLSPAGSRVKPCARYRRHVIRFRKMSCIWFELLQWYVDEIEVLKSRTDSALLLSQARLIRDRLVSQGHQECDMPKINADFLRRWRIEYGISIRLTTVRFKVSLDAATARVRVMLSNIFRLRRLWALCHGDRPMRWVSFDQKPSWFNNAGLRPQYARKGTRKVGAKEDHAGTRQRYTIMSTVQSWTDADVLPGGVPLAADAGVLHDGVPRVVPKCAVLFKATSGTRTFASLGGVHVDVLRQSFPGTCCGVLFKFMSCVRGWRACVYVYVHGQLVYVSMHACVCMCAYGERHHSQDQCARLAEGADPGERLIQDQGRR